MHPFSPHNNSIIIQKWLTQPHSLLYNSNNNTAVDVAADSNNSNTQRRLTQPRNLPNNCNNTEAVDAAAKSPLTQMWFTQP